MPYSLKKDHQNKIIHYTHIGDAGLDEIGKCWEELVDMQVFAAIKWLCL